MGLQEKILSLMKGIDDPAMRMEVFRSIQFLFEVYTTGEVSEEEILDDLVDIAATVLSMKHPEKTEEQIMEEAKKLAGELMAHFRAETITRRLLAKRRLKRRELGI